LSHRLLFFIFQELALKPVDLSRPEGSDISQIPAQESRGDYKLLIEVERKETHREEGHDGGREKAHLCSSSCPE